MLVVLGRQLVHVRERDRSRDDGQPRDTHHGYGRQDPIRTAPHHDHPLSASASVVSSRSADNNGDAFRTVIAMSLSPCWMWR
ncbi:hypothetical protein [Micromonospora sp. Llam0]|uniref:hypothetical protein n=1 Tax=Micromonospora sp. Llam0 TaxID=2485143 RepID=UPI0018F776FF|nr:hypothetical protein [Micromonospora sp. Llam0]